MALLSALVLCLAAQVAGVAFPRGSDYANDYSGSDYGAAADPTEVLSVPGFDGALPSRHFAGYVTVDEAHGRQARSWRRGPVTQAGDADTRLTYAALLPALLRARSCSTTSSRRSAATMTTRSCSG